MATATITYLVSYDLIEKKDYKALIDKIKSYSGWAKIHKSLWAVLSTKSAADVFDDLKGEIDADDKLLVVKSGREAKWTKISDEVDKWMLDTL